MRFVAPQRIGYERFESLLQRFATAFLAASDRSVAVILAARAAPPFRPILAAPASFPSSVVSGTCPVAMSTMSLPSWIGSRGRGVRFVAIP